MRGKKKTKDNPASHSMMRRFGITGKLVMAIVVTIVIMVGALLLIVRSRVSDALLAKSENLLEETTDKAIQEVNAWMSGILATLETQRDTIQYDDMDVARMEEYIKHTVNQNSAYPAGIYVALTDGSLHHASFIPGPDYNALEKPWYKDGLSSEDFILGAAYFDEDSQSYVVGASGVLRDALGGTRGVAAADVYLNSISDIVSEIRLEKTGGIYLVDTRTNTIIGHPDTEMNGRSMAEFNGDMYAYAAQKIQSGSTGLSLYDDKMYIEVTKVPNCEWVAVSYVSRDEVLADLNTADRYHVIGSRLRSHHYGYSDNYSRKEHYRKAGGGTESCCRKDCRRTSGSVCQT